MRFCIVTIVLAGLSISLAEEATPPSPVELMRQLQLEFHQGVTTLEEKFEDRRQKTLNQISETVEETLRATEEMVAEVQEELNLQDRVLVSAELKTPHLINAMAAFAESIDQQAATESGKMAKAFAECQLKEHEVIDLNKGYRLLDDEAQPPPRDLNLLNYYSQAYSRWTADNKGWIQGTPYRKAMSQLLKIHMEKLRDHNLGDHKPNDQEAADPPRFHQTLEAYEASLNQAGAESLRLLELYESVSEQLAEL